MKRFLRVWGAASALVFVGGAAWVSAVHAQVPSAGTGSANKWVATWQASPQPVWGAEFLFPTNLPGVLKDQTLRQNFRISLGGSRVRVVLSNAYGSQPLKIGKATLARAGTGALSAEAALEPASLRHITFGGEPAATILPGASLLSDPIALPVSALEPLTLSLYLPEATPVQTFHWDGRQTGWIVQGDQTETRSLQIANGAGQRTTARALFSGVQVELASPRLVVALGDSITDGATASLDGNSRWPDFLARRLAPHGLAVVNAGISGARLLSDGMGVNALARLERDVLAQPGVQSVIVLIGVNDIAWPGTAFARNEPRPTLESLKAGYLQLIAQARSRGVQVIGATLTPFEGALPGTSLADYYQPEKEALRQALNDWIRHGKAFDQVVDFDAALRDPQHPARMNVRFDSGDRLHPGDEGNRAMADAVDIDALLRWTAGAASSKKH